jgi:hypothetical protein
MLHVKFCKVVLGVHKKATNHAVRGDLGSYPILLFMISLAIKYWWGLNMDCFKGKNTLVIKSLIVENRKLDAAGTFTWSTGIKNIFKLINKLDVWDKPLLFSKSKISSCILSSLHDIYNELWVNKINNHSPKLRTYCKFKHSFMLENYVSILKRSKRSTFCKLRVSAHRLKIEMDRYKHPRIPPEQRLCILCNHNEVEDEFHFMMRCSLYDDIRLTLLNSIQEMFNLNNITDNMDIFNLLMCANNYDSINVVVKYVTCAFEKRATLMQPPN